MGAWSRGKWHGRGVLQLKNGDKFDGSFHQGVKFGRGKFTWADGSYYEVRPSAPFEKERGGSAGGRPRSIGSEALRRYLLVSFLGGNAVHVEGLFVHFVFFQHPRGRVCVV